MVVNAAGEAITADAGTVGEAGGDDLGVATEDGATVDGAADATVAKRIVSAIAAATWRYRIIGKSRIESKTDGIAARSDYHLKCAASIGSAIPERPAASTARRVFADGSQMVANLSKQELSIDLSPNARGQRSFVNVRIRQASVLWITNE
jgi:hypothetical protein